MDKQSASMWRELAILDLEPTAPRYSLKLMANARFPWSDNTMKLLQRLPISSKQRRLQKDKKSKTQSCSVWAYHAMETQFLFQKSPTLLTLFILAILLS
jgi:hypothetical protein